MSTTVSPYRPLTPDLKADKAAPWPGKDEGLVCSKRGDDALGRVQRVRAQPPVSDIDVAATSSAAVNAAASGDEEDDMSQCRRRCSVADSTSAAATAVSVTALIVAGLAVVLAGILAVGVYRLSERVNVLEGLHRRREQTSTFGRTNVIGDNDDDRHRTQPLIVADISAAVKLPPSDSGRVVPSENGLTGIDSSSSAGTTVGGFDDWTDEQVAVLNEVRIHLYGDEVATMTSATYFRAVYRRLGPYASILRRNCRRMRGARSAQSLI